MKEVSEKAWLADTRQKLATRLKVDPATLRFSPSKRLVACVREVAARKKVKRPPPRRHQIIVVDPDGARRALFEAVSLRGSDEPPKDFRFLAEDRLIYEVVQPSPPSAPVARKRASPARRRARGKRPAHVAPPSVPPSDPLFPRRLLVIQPIEGRQRPIRCDGARFTFTGQHDHFAFVTGKPEAEFVSVDGVQVYPRRGRTIITSDPAWSKDGRSLAFVEMPAAGKPRLVLLGEFDNPTGDTTWELPPSASAPASVEGVRVLWSGPAKLVVARSPTKPLFSTSFVKEKPPVPEGRFKNAGP
jgi:hypothetical protein